MAFDKVHRFACDSEARLSSATIIPVITGNLPVISYINYLKSFLLTFYRIRIKLVLSVFLMNF